MSAAPTDNPRETGRSRPWRRCRRARATCFFRLVAPRRGTYKAWPANRNDLPEFLMRPSRRQPDELRAVSLERGVVKYAEGSCFVKFGDTHVLVTATLEERLPPWLKGQARG